MENDLERGYVSSHPGDTFTLARIMHMLPGDNCLSASTAYALTVSQSGQSGMGWNYHHSATVSR